MTTDTRAWATFRHAIEVAAGIDSVVQATLRHALADLAADLDPDGDPLQAGVADYLPSRHAGTVYRRAPYGGAA